MGILRWRSAREDPPPDKALILVRARGPAGWTYMIVQHVADDPEYPWPHIDGIADEWLLLPPNDEGFET